MSIKARLTKVESRAAQAKQMPHVNSEETRQWLKNTVQSINDGTTYIPQPRKPLAPDASPTAIWLDNLLNEMEMTA